MTYPYTAEVDLGDQILVVGFSVTGQYLRATYWEPEEWPDLDWGILEPRGFDPTPAEFEIIERELWDVAGEMKADALESIAEDRAWELRNGT